MTEFHCAMQKKIRHPFAEIQIRNFIVEGLNRNIDERPIDRSRD
jgi:hypothetical protein